MKKTLTKKQRPIASKKKQLAEVSVLTKQMKSKSGHIKIWHNTHTNVYHWSVIAANGLTTSNATGLNSMAACIKGIKSVAKTLNACLK